MVLLSGRLSAEAGTASVEVGVAALIVKFSAGAPAVTGPDTRTFFEDEPLTEEHDQTHLRGEQVGCVRRLPVCTPEKATPVQPLGHLGTGG